ncbi:MAG: winged helix DNA-binding protein [Myxococcales bacterium]
MTDDAEIEASQPSPSLPLPQEAAMTLLQLMPWLQRSADEAVRKAGALTPPRVRMLMVLTEGSRRGSEIAERWNISRAAVAEAAAALERDGMLRRVADKDDGRAVRFALTAKGRRGMETFGVATTTALAEHVGRLSPAKQRALRDIGRELLQHLSGNAGGTENGVKE